MLDRCYHCGYSLEGLPDQHKCPECGLPYDRNAQVITQAVRAPILWMIFGAFGAVANAPLIVAAVTLWNLIFRSLLVFLTASMFVYGWRCFRQRNRAVLFPEHLVLLGRFASGLGGGARTAWSVPWADVSRVDYRTVGGSVVIRNRDGQSIITVDSNFLGSAARTQELIRLANERIAACRNG